MLSSWLSSNLIILHFLMKHDCTAQWNFIDNILYVNNIIALRIFETNPFGNSTTSISTGTDMSYCKCQCRNEFASQLSCSKNENVGIIDLLWRESMSNRCFLSANQRKSHIILVCSSVGSVYNMESVIILKYLTFHERRIQNIIRSYKAVWLYEQWFKFS